jgi:hypothetical protein
LPAQQRGLAAEVALVELDNLTAQLKPAWSGSISSLSSWP